jgi:prolyl-tRNA synthetase
MKSSNLFTKTIKNIPVGETAKNAQLLIRAGYIYKDSAGVYALLPLGLMVIENIKSIIRKEMNSINAQEILMTSLQRKELWQQTDRWDDNKVSCWFKSRLKNGTEVGLAWSHEEQITDMMRTFVASYRDLPVNVYQFQNKLRNETRARSGIIRAREFLMKDLYSYSRTEEEHQAFYDSVSDAYLRVFSQIGLGESTFLTFASGGDFTQFSHEFQTITPAGEDTIYLHRGKKIAVNEEVMGDEVLAQLGLSKDELEKLQAAEVGNIFSFGDVKSAQLGCYYTDDKGQQKPVILGSYGIGVTRLMGVMAESLSDDKGLIWPVNVAPATVYLAFIGNDDAVIKAANDLYDQLQNANIKVIFDDRETSAGEKFADADLIGLPYRITVSPKTLEKSQFELKARNANDPQLLTAESVIKILAEAVAN